MTRIKAFKGLRFNKEKVNYSDVVTQPYDKISSELLDDYYKKSPYTTAKLIRNKSADPYAAAAQNLEEWIKEKILKYDEQPAIYAYYQEYQLEGIKKIRKGFVALVGLEEFSSKIILPHERILAKPKADRLNLMRATHANFGQIFLLYSDKKNQINKLLLNYTQKEADEIVTDHFGDIHKLWKIEDQAVITRIAHLMAEKQLLIADGHHRYSTACDFAREMGQAPGSEGPYAYCMATLINMDDEGLTILPTHRMLHGLKNFDQTSFLKNCSTFFDVDKTTDLENTLTILKQNRQKNIFGFYAGKSFYTLTLKEPQELDVLALHSVIFENILGVSKDKQASQENLSYIRTATSAVKQVANKEQQAVFLLNPTDVYKVRKIAQAGEVMPQKSTDFYPKLLSGMVFYKIRE